MMNGRAHELDHCQTRVASLDDGRNARAERHMLLLGRERMLVRLRQEDA